MRCNQRIYHLFKTQFLRLQLEITRDTLGGKMQKEFRMMVVLCVN